MVLPANMCVHSARALIFPFKPLFQLRVPACIVSCALEDLATPLYRSCSLHQDIDQWHSVCHPKEDALRQNQLQVCKGMLAVYEVHY